MVFPPSLTRLSQDCLSIYIIFLVLCVVLCFVVCVCVCVFLFLFFFGGGGRGGGGGVVSSYCVLCQGLWLCYQQRLEYTKNVIKQKAVSQMTNNGPQNTAITITFRLIWSRWKRSCCFTSGIHRVTQVKKSGGKYYTVINNERSK